MSEATKQHGAKTILIVDDDEDFRMQTQLQLRAAGYSVLEADGEQAAMSLVEGTRPDLAIVDLMMDEVDSGFTLCYRLKKKFPGMPVIMATGVASEAGLEFDAATDEERSWIKADALLNKPMRFEQLRKELNRLLE